MGSLTEEKPIFDVKDDLPDFGDPPSAATVAKERRALLDVRPHFETPPPAPRPGPLPPLGVRRWAVRISLLFAMLCVTSVLVHWGFLLRDGLFDSFPMMRHHGDINNAYRQGLTVNQIAIDLMLADGKEVSSDTKAPWSYIRRAIVKRFDDAYKDADNDRFEFDYVPLRLLVATMWVRGTTEWNVQNNYANPTIPEWQDGFKFTKPMLHFNTFMAAFTAVAMFLLVRHWVLRAGRPAAPSPWERLRQFTGKLRTRAAAPANNAGTLDYATSETPFARTADPRPLEPRHRGPTIKAWALAWLAAMLVWFEPNILVESHIWPQWDLWIVPFFVLAVWLASANWWYSAGLALGVGVMMKGQLLFAAPLLVMWPLFDFRFGALARILVGFATSFLFIASPWLLATREAMGVLLLAVGACAIMAPYFWLKRSTWIFGVATALVVLGVLCPFVFKWQWPAFFAGLPLALFIAAGPWLFARRSLGVWLMAVVCATTVLAAVFWDGSPSWWKIGFGYGTRHYQVLYMGPSVNNLAAILRDIYHWELYDRVFTTDIPTFVANRIRGMYDANEVSQYLTSDGQLIVSIKALMTSIYVVILPILAWAVARHARRNDKRFLIAIAAPWVIFFAVMPQMHERYLFWAAIVTVAGVGVSLGGGLLWLLTSLMSVGMILLCQLPSNPRAYLFYPKAWDEALQDIRFVLAGGHPGMSWMTLLLACVYLFLAVTSTRKRPAATGAKNQRPPTLPSADASETPRERHDEPVITPERSPSIATGT